MTIKEDSYSPSSSTLSTGHSTLVKDIDLDAPMPSSSSTIIHMIPIPSPSSSSLRSSTKKQRADDQLKDPHLSTRRQLPLRKISIGHLKGRLRVRETYLNRLALVSNLMCIFAIVGIGLMIIENELIFTRINNKDSKASWFIKLIITFSTTILLILILYYHYLDMSLYSFRNLLEDWRVELTPDKILLITLELLICAIHPIPRSYPHSNRETINLNSTEINAYSLSYTAADVGLGLPMFLRLYLLGRCIMFHSHLVRNLSLRSLGYLNQVSIDFYFLMKTYLDRWPTRCLITFCTITFLIGSWSLRACDYKVTREHMSMSEAMWLFVITFTTVGYGDLYPSTYCGRSIATLIALIGLILSALLIAILAQKLVLRREEKYVHTFVLNTQLAKQRRYHAANVVKFAVKIWYLKRHNKYTFTQYCQANRKLFRSIRCLQEIRQEQRHLRDHCVGFIEVMAAQNNATVQTTETVEQMMALEHGVKNIKEELHKINHHVETLQRTLQVLLEKDRK